MAARELSAVEVVEAHVAAMYRCADALNAVVAMARAPDKARAARRGPLSGLPFTVKDNIAVAGAPLIAGDPERHARFACAPEDATAVGRLLAAGAIFLGKTNCPWFGGGIETTNEVFGRTNNPYDLTRTVGGSSGGEAAAIAAGCSAFGLGTDSGGSVRLPAHFCGLAALKPTAGRVPLHGVIDDLGPVGPLRDPRTQIGILARGVADLALVLSVIENRPAASPPAASPPAPSPRDASPPAPSPPAVSPLSADVRGLRVALVADDGISRPDGDTARVV